MRIGICTPVEHLAAAAEAGFAYAEIGVYALRPEEDDAAFAPVRQFLRAAPLPIEACNCFLPGHLHVTGPEVDLEAVGAHMARALCRAAEVSVAIMVFGSAGSRRVPEDFPLDRARAQFVTAARLAGDLAARHGITIALEPLSPAMDNLLTSVADGVMFTREIDHPHVRLLADLFHFAAAGEPLEHLRAAAPYLAHLHLATPALPDAGPGTTYDFHGFLHTAYAGGYSGRASLEDNPRLLTNWSTPLTPRLRGMREFIEEAWRGSSTE